MLSTPSPRPAARNKLVLFLGNVRRGEYESLLARGYSLGVILDSEASGQVADLSEFQVVERCPLLSSPEKLLPIFESLQQSWEICTVLNLREYYISAFVDLGRRYHLRTPSFAAVKTCADKATTRALFRAHLGDDSTGKSRVVSTLRELEIFASDCRFPLVLKPATLYGSLFVVRVSERAELETKWSWVSQRTAKYLAEKSPVARELVLQAEEFLQGSNHSVDCAIGSSGEPVPSPVIDVLTGNDIGHADFHHFARVAPSRLTDSQQSEMRALAVKAARVLGIRNGIAHVEFIQTPHGPRLLETAVRPGGNRIRILSRCFGVDLLDAYVRATTGERVRMAERWRSPFAIVTPFPESEGCFVGLRDFGRVLRLPSYSWHALTCQQGELIGSARHGYMSRLHIELSANTTEELRKDISAIASMRDLFSLEEK